MKHYRLSLEKSAEVERSKVSIYDEFRVIINKEIKGKCLEIGCGDGLSTSFLKNKVPFLISLDLSEKRIRIAKKINNDVMFVLADARKLPFKDAVFDSICAFEVIEHLPTREDHVKFLSEIKRVLSKKGTFLISTPNKPLFRIYCWLLRERHSTHFSELNYFQFKSILRKHFSFVRIYGKFGWFSPFYKYKFIKKIHEILSKFTPFCKGYLQFVKNNV